MFFVFLIIFSVFFSCFDLIFLKIYQLNGYKITNYLKNVAKFNFSFGKKTPLKFTKRVKRQIFVDFLLNFCTFFAFFWFFSDFWICFAVIFARFVFSPFVFLLSCFFTVPIEGIIKKFYIKKARKKLQLCKCKIVAITGSFGKTSTKEFLSQMLSAKFSVCSSPKSFNTPMGICRTILENLKESDDFLVLEFGARRKGDVKKLCNLFGVDYGIITPLGACHMETFKSMQNIENTKFELCEVAKFVVFNGTSKGSKNLFNRFCGEKILCGSEGSFAFVKDVKTGTAGSEFTLVLGDKKLLCRTAVLGKGFLDNIAAAAAMACVLGVESDKIKEKIELLKSPKHRLQLISSGRVTVIDDSYNSNFDGFCEALSVLSQFEGRKVVVSPGIVELGKLQFEINKKIGKITGEIADIFIIMNETNRKALSLGAGDLCEVHFAKNETERKRLLDSLLQTGDVVLFENDLPDNMR